MAQDGPNQWEHRSDQVAEIITELDADVVALQETSQKMWMDLEAHLDPWIVLRGFVDHDKPWAGGTFTHDGPERRLGPRATGNGLLLKKDKFRILDEDQFWISDTPEVPRSVTFANDWGPRIALWARVAALESSLTFVAVCTHWDTHRDSHLPSAELCAKMLGPIAGNQPLLFMGDFNAPGGGPAWLCLEDNGFRDAWTQSGKKEEGVFSYHEFSGKDLTGEGRIDWILHKGPWKVLNCSMDLRSKQGLYPSDHFPVWADWQAGPG